jgi:hypothetical protein
MVPPHNTGEIDPRRRFTRAKQLLGLNGWEAADVSVQATLADGRAMLLGRVADELANSGILAECERDGR